MRPQRDGQRHALPLDERDARVGVPDEQDRLQSLSGRIGDPRLSLRVPRVAKCFRRLALGDRDSCDGECIP